MRKRKQLVLTIILGLLLAGLTWFAGLGRQTERTQLVVSARNDLSAGIQLSQDHLKLVSLPIDLVNENHFHSIEQLVGLWTKNILLTDEIVLAHRVSEQSEGLIYPDPAPGRRLLTLRMQPAQANGLWLAAGNTVDVHLIPRHLNSGYESQQLREIRIVAVLGPNRTDAGQEATKNLADSLICLDLSVEQADLIAAMLDHCTVRLAVVNE